jgi:hypothetical protein
MRYSEKQKVRDRIIEDIEKLKEYPEVEHFIDAHFQMSCVCGEYDDNSMDLSYHYKMLKAIEEDDKFMDKLNFVLGRYVTMSAKATHK